MYIWIIKKIIFAHAIIMSIMAYVGSVSPSIYRSAAFSTFLQVFFLIEFLLTITFHPKNYNKYHLQILLAYDSWLYCLTLLCRWPTRQLDNRINRMPLPCWVTYNKAVGRNLSSRPSSTASSGPEISKSCPHQWTCKFQWA